MLGAANRWYTEELDKVIRLGLRGADVDTWCNMLKARFKLSSGRALASLEGLRFGITDIRNGRDPLDFLSEFKHLAMHAGIVSDERS